MDREDRTRGQINRKLKQKTEDFEKLHWDHKKLNAEHKKLIAECDRQQEKVGELRADVAKKTNVLVEEQTKAVESAKLLEEVSVTNGRNEAKYQRE